MSNFTRAGAVVLAAAAALSLTGCYYKGDSKPSPSPRSPLPPRTSMVPGAMGVDQVQFPDTVGTCKATAAARAEGEKLRLREYECSDPNLPGALTLYAEKLEYPQWRAQMARIQQQGAYECGRVNRDTSCGFPLKDGALHATTAREQKPEGLRTLVEALTPMINGGDGSGTASGAPSPTETPNISNVPMPEDSTTEAPATTS